MKLLERCSNDAKRKRAAFTLLELLVASSCAALLIAGGLVFMNFAQVSVLGIAAQATVSSSAARAIAFMQSRIRFATSVTADTAGNTLTLGFDDDYKVDSDNDGLAFNDQNHYETFGLSGTNVTNSATASSNRLIYTPKVGANRNSVLVPFGVRNLPGLKIFTIANLNTAIIRFGVVDPSSQDRFQSIDVQATGVSLNRPASSTVIAVTP